MKEIIAWFKTNKKQIFEIAKNKEQADEYDVFDEEQFQSFCNNKVPNSPSKSQKLKLDFYMNPFRNNYES